MSEYSVRKTEVVLKHRGHERYVGFDEFAYRMMKAQVKSELIEDHSNEALDFPLRVMEKVLNSFLLRHGIRTELSPGEWYCNYGVSMNDLTGSTCASIRPQVHRFFTCV